MKKRVAVGRHGFGNPSLKTIHTMITDPVNGEFKHDEPKPKQRTIYINEPLEINEVFIKVDLLGE